MNEDEDYQDEDESNMLEFCPHCGREYDEIDYEYQMCNNCHKEA